jgi:hypothetical protein
MLRAMSQHSARAASATTSGRLTLDAAYARPESRATTATRAATPADPARDSAPPAGYIVLSGSIREFRRRRQTGRAAVRGDTAGVASVDAAKSGALA